MSELEDLRRKIYQRTPDVDSRPGGRLSSVDTPRPDLGWQAKQEKSFFMRNVWLFITALFVIGGGFILLLFGTAGFSQDNIYLTISAPQEVNGIEIVEWRVRVSNQNTLDLEDAQLIFEYPDNSFVLDDPNESGGISRINLGLIEGRKDVERLFKARLFGQEDEIKDVKALLRFKTPGISRELEKEVDFSSRILSSSLNLNVIGPDELESGSEALWNIAFRNLSDFDLSLLRVRIGYPQGFSFIDATPFPHFDNTRWDIASLKIGQEQSIELKGRLSGDIGQEKSLKVFLEYPLQGGNVVTLTTKMKETAIAISPLSISLQVNGKNSYVAGTGEVLTLSVAYKNNSSKELNDVFIEADFIDEEVIDVKSVETPGAFDASQSLVRWDFTNTSALKAVRPGDTGTLQVLVQLKDVLPISSFADKNFKLRTLVTIGSDNPPGTIKASDIKKTKEIVVPLRTNLELRISGSYSGSQPFKNTGGIPPQVNKQTTYTVFWRLINTSNDVRDLELTATLPSWASFTGLTEVNFEQDNFYYDSNARQVVWIIDTLPATTGVALPVYEAAFQISVAPEARHIGEIIDVVGSTDLRGIDVFTQELIKELYAPIGTDMAGKIHTGLARVVN